jgi:hypothetical protein
MCTVLYCTVLYCTVLYCTVLHCTVLHCTVLYCTVLYCTAPYCTVLHRTVLYCTALYCTALHCTVLYCTALYCTVLHCTVLYCTALYCTALHCTVLYWTVLYCTALYCTVLYYCHLVATQLQLTNILISKSAQNMVLWVAVGHTIACLICWYPDVARCQGIAVIIGLGMAEGEWRMKRWRSRLIACRMTSCGSYIIRRQSVADCCKQDSNGTAGHVLTSSGTASSPGALSCGIATSNRSVGVGDEQYAVPLHHMADSDVISETRNQKIWNSTNKSFVGIHSKISCRSPLCCWQCTALSIPDYKQSWIWHQSDLPSSCHCMQVWEPKSKLAAGWRLASTFVRIIYILKCISTHVLPPHRRYCWR